MDQLTTVEDMDERTASEAEVVDGEGLTAKDRAAIAAVALALETDQIHED